MGISLSNAPHLPRPNQAHVTLRLGAASLVLIGTGACTSGVSRPRSVVPVQAFWTNAFRVAQSQVSSRHHGLHVAGAVCRRRQDVVRPQTVRLERVGAAGQLLETTEMKLGRLEEHPIHCVFDDAPTSCRLDAGDEIRVCLNQDVVGEAGPAVCGPAS